MNWAEDAGFASGSRIWAGRQWADARANAASRSDLDQGRISSRYVSREKDQPYARSFPAEHRGCGFLSAKSVVPLGWCDDAAWGIEREAKELECFDAADTGRCGALRGWGAVCRVLRHGEPRALGAVIVRMFALGLLAALCWRRRSLTVWIFWAMLVGIEFGLDAPAIRGAACACCSDIFLRLIKMIVAPLIFGTLVTGIASHGELRRVGSPWLKVAHLF